MELSTPAIAYIALCFLLAGTVKGTVGVGMPTVVMGTVTLAVEPRVGITILLWPILITNVWQVIRTGKVRQSLTRYRWFLIALMPLVLLFALLSAQAPNQLLYAVAGLAILAFVASQLLFHPPAIPDHWDRPAQLTLGSIAGVLGGLSSMWAVPTAIYLVGRQVEKDEFVRATGIILLCGSLALFAGYAGEGAVTGPLTFLSLGMLIPTLLGYAVGERLRARIDQKQFMRLLYVLFIVLGVNLLRRSITA